MEKVIDFADYLIKALVDNPDDVELSVYQKVDDSNKSVDVISCKVHNDDIGVCIGVGGKHSDMLRTFICVYGYKQLNKPVYLR